MVGLVIVITLLLLLVIGVQAAGGASGRRRARELATWATSNGWSFEEGDVSAPWRNRVRGLSRFAIRRMVSGTVDGFPVTIADGQYERNANERRIIHDLVLLCVQLPGPGPETRVEARGVVSDTLRALGLKNGAAIKTGNADFDQRFAITTADPQWAAQLFSPALIEAISADDVYSWTLHGDELLVVKKERFVVYNTERHAAYIVRMALLLLE